jgi:hypothetical protein
MLYRKATFAFELKAESTGKRNQSVTTTQQADGVDLEAVTNAGLRNSPAGGKIFQQVVKMFPQVGLHFGCHFTDYSRKQQTSCTRGRIHGEVALTECNPSCRRNGSGVVDLQFGDDHGIDGTTELFTV